MDPTISSQNSIATPCSAASEKAWINWLSNQKVKLPAFWKLGIGDDAAIFAPNQNEELVISTDMLLDGACFILAEAGPKAVGRKSLAVNLSDMAAMAAKPVGCFFSVALPKTGSQDLAREIALGLLGLAEKFDCPLVGGDTNTWNGPLALSITVLGTVEKGKAIRRSGAKPGDWLFVTGPLGGSILGHHLHFTPRVVEAIQLNKLVNIHAMMDISDGLARDTRTLCEASHCGGIIISELIPIRPEACLLEKIKTMGIRGETPLEHALGDGEDYELLFAVSPEDGQKLLNTQPLAGITLHRIGECTPNGFFLEEKGIQTELPTSGWQHNL